MKNIPLCITLLLLSGSLWGQKNLQKGNEAYDKMEYFDAITYYEKVLEKEDNPEAVEKIAFCYMRLRESVKAENYYRRAVEIPGNSPYNCLYYAQCLLANGKPVDAMIWANRFSVAVPNDPRGRHMVYAIEHIQDFYAHEKQTSVTNCAFNLPDYDEFAPFLKGETLFFTSDRGDYDPKTGWSGRSYTRIFQSDKSFKNILPSPGDINSDFHDGSVCFSRDGQTMYFTRNNVNGKKSRKSSDNIVNLMIVKAILNNNVWQLDSEFSFNSPEYSCAYPTLSADENTLVFSSDKPGGMGGMDLYVCRRQNGQWSNPENLGAAINTPGEETFPFLMPDGVLVFSSDAHPGLGGQDLFKAAVDNQRWTNPGNLGAPFNSTKDDFGFWSKAGFESGYFSSNRFSADGLDDIVQFEKNKAPNQVTGLVVDKYTQIPLKEVDITAKDLKTGQTFYAKSGEDGQFKIELPAGMPFQLDISGIKNGISTTQAQATFKAEDMDKSEFVQLEHNDPRFTLEGFSLNKKDKSPVEGTLVKLLNTATGKTETAMSGKDGKFSFQLAQKADYRITGEKGGYYSTVANASTKGLDRTTTLYVNLFLYTQVVVIGEDIDMKGSDNPMNIKDIYYDYNDHRIRADAAIELDKLVDFLKLNANLKVVELSAHTDSRGKTEFNQTLSDKRAQAAVDYLVSKGIQRSRLKWQGFGESKLVNKCADGVTCSEKQHQENRRTVFKVLEIEK